MNPAPTGRIVTTADGINLILERTFRAPIQDVWESVTVSESTARWFGRWEGDAGPGKTIRVQMLFEKGEPWTEARINACEPPRRLAWTTLGFVCELELTLVAEGDTTRLTLTQSKVDPKWAPDMGPGWEYYLDNLVAARAGKPLPKFEDYYPSQKQYFSEQLPAPTT